MTDRSGAIELLWSAGSIAVLGASERPGSLGALPISYLIRYGYSGVVVPVNPSAESIQGLRCYPSLDAAPRPIDLAMIMVGAARVPDAIDDCGRAGVPIAIVGASGFAEAGEAGEQLQLEVAERARAAGVRLLGPNCIGAVAFGSRMLATFTPLFSAQEVPWRQGPLGFVSQSGALGFGAVSLALERGLGLGWAVNTGNEADISALEVLQTLAADDGCDALLAYVEQLTDGEALRRLVDAGKPVAVVKAGSSDAGAAAAASHTGALATSDRIVSAALRQLGIARAGDVDELLDFGEAFAQPRRPAGPRVAIVSTSGGSGILATDAIASASLVLAELTPDTTNRLEEFVPAFGSAANPVDVTAAVMSDITVFERCFGAVADDPNVDLVIACFCVLVDKDVDAIVRTLAVVAERTEKPVFVARTGANFLAPRATEALRDAGLPSYPTPTRAVRAADALWTVSRPRGRAESHHRLVGPPSMTDEHSLKMLLASAGLSVVDGRLVTSAEDATSAVKELGGRAAAKALVPGVLHKTDLGAVELDVVPSGAAAVYERLIGFGGAIRFEAMLTGHTEVLVGATSTPLGVVISVGSGGIHAESINDVAVRLAPIGRDEAATMVAETAVGRALADERGDTLDVDALYSLISELSKMTCDWPPGFELDLNPVAISASGATILDAAYVEHAAP